MYEYEFHAVANLFPLMNDEELNTLAQDIKVNGLLEPIWLHENKIIDGRNRYRACLIAGVEPQFRDWDGNGSLVTFIVSLNLHRRHLTSGQRAAVGVDMLPLLEAEARERRKATEGRPRKDEKLTEIIPEVILPPSDREAREIAAKLTDTNAHYVSDAKRIKETSPDIFEKLRSGELNMTQARREVAKRDVYDAPPIPSDKYGVIYADPPWKYESNMSEQYGGAVYHYPSMTIDELCALPVADLADRNAVLFMWVTSPKLNECFEIIESWGFTYKTSFVWDKIKHNYGHYNSVRHEMLLIAGRGKSVPQTSELHDSVISIERTEHSVKPEYFRELIEKMYPTWRKIELFARDRADGWDVWGNQV